MDSSEADVEPAEPGGGSGEGGSVRGGDDDDDEVEDDDGDENGEEDDDDEEELQKALQLSSQTMGASSETKVNWTDLEQPPVLAGGFVRDDEHDGRENDSDSQDDTPLDKLPRSQTAQPAGTTSSEVAPLATPIWTPQRSYKDQMVDMLARDDKTNTLSRHGVAPIGSGAGRGGGFLHAEDDECVEESDEENAAAARGRGFVLSILVECMRPPNSLQQLAEPPFLFCLAGEGCLTAG